MLVVYAPFVGELSVIWNLLCNFPSESLLLWGFLCYCQHKESDENKLPITPVSK